METLKDIQNKEWQFIKEKGGFWAITEFDQDINTISREKIQAFSREHKECYLFNMNYYDKNTPEFIPYTEQKIYNFEYNWIIPEKDETLLEMIRQWNAPNDFESIHKSYKDIDAITQRIKDLGGIHLIWV